MNQLPILNEVSMTPSTLRTFLQSPAASGIYAGFEAELCFPIKVSSVPYKPCTSIDQIIDFFNDGPANAVAVIEKLEKTLNRQFALFADPDEVGPSRHGHTVGQKQGQEDQQLRLRLDLLCIRLGDLLHHLCVRDLLVYTMFDLNKTGLHHLCI